jgi:predicted nucleic acid-binding protein
MTSKARVLYVAEPPARYLARPAVVVDSSVMCAALFNEPDCQLAFEQMAGKTLVAPRLLGYEVVSVAIKKLRLGVAPELVTTALAHYFDNSIDIVDPPHPAQFALANQYGLSAYDAAYLWLAAELPAQLLTFDKKLASAARKHLSGLG